MGDSGVPARRAHLRTISTPGLLVVVLVRILLEYFAWRGSSATPAARQDMAFLGTAAGGLGVPWHFRPTRVLALLHLDLGCATDAKHGRDAGRASLGARRSWSFSRLVRG